MDKAPRPAKTAEKIHWHPAFFQAIKADLLEWKEVLQFEYEYQLTSEPLRVDTLIILKPPGVTIEHQIGQLFRAVNIVEYKSPEDSFTVKDFYKVYAYGALYAAITPEVGMADLTLTFVMSRHPRELIKYFRTERGYEVKERRQGIYEVRGDYLPMQIVECPKLAAEHQLMRGLQKNLKREEAASILEEGKRRGREQALDAYFDAIFHANPRPFQEVVKMGDSSLTFEDVLMEEGFIPKWLAQGEERGIKKGREEGLEEGLEKGLEKGREEVARNLLKKGWGIEETAETAELAVEKVRLLVQNIR